MEFEKRLQQAIERGEKRQREQAQSRAEQELSEEECRRIHSQLQLELSDHVEHCLKQVVDYLPGFRLSHAVAEKGMGAELSRNDFGKGVHGERRNYLSRLEVVVRPYSAHRVIDVAAKATVRDKEVFHTNAFQKISAADIDQLRQQIDQWTLEFAERYSAGT